MPGTIPATSQLDRLISMTAINVLAGSRAMRDRLKLFNVCMGSSIGSQRTMDAISTPPPHSIFHHGISKTRWNNLLGGKHSPDNKQRLDQQGHIGKVRDQLLDARLKLNRPHYAHLKAEVAQGGTQVVLDGDGLRLK